MRSPGKPITRALPIPAGDRQALREHLPHDDHGKTQIEDHDPFKMTNLPLQMIIPSFQLVNLRHDEFLKLSKLASYGLLEFDHLRP